MERKWIFSTGDALILTVQLRRSLASCSRRRKKCRTPQRTLGHWLPEFEWNLTEPKGNRRNLQHKIFRFGATMNWQHFLAASFAISVFASQEKRNTTSEAPRNSGKDVRENFAKRTKPIGDSNLRMATLWLAIVRCRHRNLFCIVRAAWKNVERREPIRPMATNATTEIDQIEKFSTELAKYVFPFWGWRYFFRASPTFSAFASQEKPSKASENSCNFA